MSSERRPDTRQPIETFEGPDAKAEAQRAAAELRGMARRYLCDLEARVVKEGHYKHGGQWRTRSVWGVFLVPWEDDETPGEDGPSPGGAASESAPARRPGRRVQSS
jgi:hypothetical protein